MWEGGISPSKIQNVLRLKVPGGGTSCIGCNSLSYKNMELKKKIEYLKRKKADVNKKETKEISLPQQEI